jgi:hypothetical protein
MPHVVIPRLHAGFTGEQVEGSEFQIGQRMDRPANTGGMPRDKGEQLFRAAGIFCQSGDFRIFRRRSTVNSCSTNRITSNTCGFDMLAAVMLVAAMVFIEASPVVAVLAN